MASSYAKLREERANKNYGTSDPDVGYARGSSTEFFQICDKITTHLFTITRGTTDLEKTLKLIGTPSDCQPLRDRITQLNGDTGSCVQETTSLLKSALSLTQNDKQRRIREQRLQTEFHATATRFSEVQKKVLKTIRSARVPSDMVAAELDSEASRDQLIAEGEMKHAQKKELQALEFEVAMQQEREHQIRALESDVVNIGDIMKQLSSMVSEQGAIVDTIENNIETTHGYVEEGRTELVKAASYQNKYRRRMCFCVLILLVVLIIIGIILGIHFSSN